MFIRVGNSEVHKFNINYSNKECEISDMPLTINAIKFIKEVIAYLAMSMLALHPCPFCNREEKHSRTFFTHVTLLEKTAKRSFNYTQITRPNTAECHFRLCRY